MVSSKTGDQILLMFQIPGGLCPLIIQRPKGIISGFDYETLCYKCLLKMLYYNVVLQILHHRQNKW